MDKNFYSLIPPLYVPHTLHHHPPPLCHPPSQWHRSVAVKRATVFLPTFSAVIQFAPVTCDRYLMDKNYYGYPSPSSVLEACQDSTKEHKDYGPIPPPSACHALYIITRLLCITPLIMTSAHHRQMGDGIPPRLLCRRSACPSDARLLFNGQELLWIPSTLCLLLG